MSIREAYGHAGCIEAVRQPAVHVRDLIVLQRPAGDGKLTAIYG